MTKRILSGEAAATAKAIARAKGRGGAHQKDIEALLRGDVISTDDKAEYRRLQSNLGQPRGRLRKEGYLLTTRWVADHGRGYLWAIKEER